MCHINMMKGLKIGWEMAKSRRNPNNQKICSICGKVFRRGGAQKYTAKYCSIQCRGVSQRGESGRRLGKQASAETRIKMSQARLGKPCLNRRGEKNPLWRGGITPKHLAIRASLEYKNWRRSVFERDLYSCVFCGAKNGNGQHVTLHADHIKPFSLFPNLRLDINNGRTLCKKCHKKTDTYRLNQHNKEFYENRNY